LPNAAGTVELVDCLEVSFSSGLMSERIEVPGIHRRPIEVAHLLLHRVALVDRYRRRLRGQDLEQLVVEIVRTASGNRRHPDQWRESRFFLSQLPAA
jgi:hypothetical protein